MATELVERANDPRIPRYMSDRFPHPYTDQDAHEWIMFAAGEQPVLNFAVFADGDLVGGVGATRLDRERTGSYEVGWWLTPEAWGRGITSSAARTLIDYVFGDLGAMHVFAPVMGPNRASVAVARKIGMTQVGLDRSAYLKGGVRYDQVNFSLTRDDWRG
jgi:RimJ/RimL family protein N-acetyltransferase